MEPAGGEQRPPAAGTNTGIAPLAPKRSRLSWLGAPIENRLPIRMSAGIDGEHRQIEEGVADDHRLHEPHVPAQPRTSGGEPPHPGPLPPAVETDLVVDPHQLAAGGAENGAGALRAEHGDESSAGGAARQARPGPAARRVYDADLEVDRPALEKARPLSGGIGNGYVQDELDERQARRAEAPGESSTESLLHRWCRRLRRRHGRFQAVSLQHSRGHGRGFRAPPASRPQA